MKKILNLIVLLLLVNVSFAQVDEPTELPDTVIVNTKSRLNYNYKPNYFTAGINGGFAFQSSDIAAEYKGWGLGVTLAKNFYYNPAAFFTFDLRGRLLFARSFGANATTSSGLTYNEALNGKRLDPLSLTYTDKYYANNRTDMFELGAEAVISFNSIRQRSRFLLQIYGGFGLDWYNVKTDQANSNGTYQSAYKVIDPNQSSSAIKNQLNGIKDGIYETSADGMTSQYGTIGVMPSLGVELGYHLTPRLILGLNHRVTFTGTDIFDGHQWKDNNIATGNNDLHHYTSLQLKWIIEPDEKKLEAPIIKIRLPSEAPYNTNEKFGLVKAQIKNCYSQSEVQAKLNGQPIGFNFISNNFSSNFLLKNGVNEYEITATNSIGSDYKKIYINYTDEQESDNIPNNIPNPQIPPAASPSPVVVVLSPNTKNYETDQNAIDIRVNIKNVNNRNNIQLSINDVVSNNFNFGNGELKSTISLQSGTTRVTVKATNNNGVSSDYINIFKIEPKQNQNPPSVSINAPTSVNGNESSCSANVMAQTVGITSYNQIVITLNNSNYTDFSFNKNNGQIIFNPILNAGNNFIKIKVSSSEGSSNAEHNIFCTLQRQLNLPVVKITSPERNNVVFNSPEVICRGTVFNVSNKSNIRCMLNGKDIPFVYNSINNEVAANVILNIGGNTFVIKANNSDGENSATMSIKYLKPLVLPKPPKVTIDAPANNTVFEVNTIKFSASTVNIKSKSDIILSINNTEFSNYSFSNNQILQDITLQDGENKIVVKVNNEYGSDEATIIIKYIKPIPFPTVSIKSPLKNAIVSKDKTPFTAIATEVTSKSNILFTNNGIDQAFDFDQNTGLITATLNNIPGFNKIKITVTNQSGKSEENLDYQYRIKMKEKRSEGRVPEEELQPKPEINIISLSKPVIDPLDPNSNRSTLIADIKYIDSRNQIVLIINGQTIDNFDFNDTNFILQYIFPLINGKNIILIKATNSVGTTEKTTTIEF